MTRREPRRCNRLTAIGFIALIVSVGAPAFAGGLFLPAHGVRALGRGGAFTAGGDDPGGIWHNPANIASVPQLQVLLDGSVVLLDLQYERVDSGGNRLPSISNGGPIIPIPTLAVTAPVWRDELVLGLSLSAPMASLPAYPEPSYRPCADISAPSRCIDTVHLDAPQRYSLISLEGTSFIQLDLAAAYRVHPRIVVGVSLQNMFASFVSLSAISSDNGVLASGPEDPDFDSLSQMKLSDMFNPSAKLGVVLSPHRRLRVGASFQLPFWIGGEGTVRVQLPVSPLYEASHVEGSRADVNIALPMALRLGVEVQPLDRLRVELGFDWHDWSMLDTIEVRPRDIYMINIPTIDRYRVPEQRIVLNFRDTFAVRLGGEYFLDWPLPFILRAGYVFERGAVERQYASVLATDNDKHLLTAGLGYVFYGFRVDVAYAYQITPDRIVDFRESRSPQVNPINPTGAAYVGGGKYSASTHVLGLGVTRAF